MNKRLFSLLLALVLCLSLAPVTAFAASDEPTAEPEITVEEPAEEPVEEPAEEPATLSLDSEADAVPPEGDTALPDWVDNSEQEYYKIESSVSSITLTGNVNLPGKYLKIDHDVTLDLSGHTLNVYNYLYIASGKTLTLKGTGGGEIVIEQMPPHNTGVAVDGTLKANGGTISANKRIGIHVYSGGTIACDNGATPTTFSLPVTLEGTISGGKFSDSVAVKNSSNNISGGTFNGIVSDGYIYGSSVPVSLNISGGTFNGEVQITYNNLNISGGTFNSRIYAEETSTSNISGGMFYGDLSSYCTLAANSHKITFMNGSSTYATQVVASGKTTTEPRTPTASANQRFTGWYTNEGCTDKFTFGSTLTDNTTLYAGFESTIASATVTANTLTYNGRAQALVSASNMKHGTVMYSLDANADLSSCTHVIPIAQNAGNYTVYYYVKATDSGYTDSAKQSVSVSIAPKEVTVSGITAADKTYDSNTTATMKFDTATINGKVDGDDLTVSATGTFADKNVGEDKTVSISNLTIGGLDAGNYTLALTGQQTETIADITKKAVTLKSATASKAYDGTALTNETVTASGMAAGEEFAYDFTGTQTDIGSSRNTFTAKDSATAKMANYDITCDYGTLTVSLPANVGDAVKGMTVDTVTSDDRKTIEDTQKTVEDYLSMEPTESEKITLNELKTKTEGLLDRLDTVKAAMEDEVITGTDGITKDNVKTSDKKALEDAKAAIEKLLEDYESNLTADEKQTLNDKLERIGDALDEIARLEKAEKNAKNKPVKTGDEANVMLWLGLGLSAALTLGYVCLRKKEN